MFKGGEKRGRVNLQRRCKGLKEEKRKQHLLNYNKEGTGELLWLDNLYLR